MKNVGEYLTEGRLKLRDFLIAPARNIGEISRQEAVQELAQKLNWRQQYLAEGMLESTMLLGLVSTHDLELGYLEEESSLLRL